MHKKQQALQLLLEQKVLPLYYHDDSNVSVQVLSCLADAGVRLVEYTNRGESALKNFEVLRKYTDKNFPELQLGIGTIKSKKQAKKFIEAGADFVVAPSINTEVGEFVSAAKLLWIPGCMTPTEIAAAENAGAELVKIFPGNLLGSGYIQAVKEIFPGMNFMVTGGVDADVKNLTQWFSSGVVAVGMGSKLLSKQLVENQDFETLTRNVYEVLQLVKSIN